MSKLKLFIENILVYGLGGIINKIVPLIMLPIITKLMPDVFYFGLNDLSNTLVSFGSAFAIMGMYDAMFRMFFEKDDENYKKEVCSTAFVFTLVNSVFIFILLIIFQQPISKFVFGDVKYGNLLMLSAISILIGSTNSIVQAPTRMRNKRKIYLITNFLSPVLSYTISIPLLIKGYYIVALPLAAIVSAISLELIFWILNKKWFVFRKFNWNLLKQMLVIAVPLLPNFLVYWIFNSSDRLMIAKLIGNEYTGVYSIGAKLGNASQLIYTAFAGGWQYFAFSTMKEKDQVKSNSLIFEYLGIISYLATLVICVLSYPIYNLFFEGDYVLGYQVSSYLFLAPLLQMLFQVAGNQFLVVKKTWPNVIILSFGAIVNIILNFVLIPVIGIEGAALATLVGYIVSDIVCVLALKKMKLMEVSFRFILSSIIVTLSMIAWRLWFRENWIIGLGMVSIVSIVYLILYHSEIGWILNKKEK